MGHICDNKFYISIGLQSRTGKTMPDEINKAACYVRVSTRKQYEEESHIGQRETLENYVEEDLDGDIDIEWFEDIAESGQDLSRVAYNEMMENANDFDAVIVRELSRFGRSLKTILNDIERLQNNNVEFISVKDNYIDTTSAQGKLFLNIMGAFNQFWADLARERTLENIEQRRKEGKPIGRPKKLSEEQISHLKNLRRENNFSYSTLAAIAQDRWDIESISRQTVYNYLTEDKSEELGNWDYKEEVIE